MGQRQSTDCCEWSEEKRSIYISGKFVLLEGKGKGKRLLYPLTKKQKKDLKQFFEHNFGCTTDFKRGLIIHLPENASIPEGENKIVAKFIVLQGIAYFYLQSIDLFEHLSKIKE